MKWLFETWVGKWLLILALVVLSSIVVTGAAYALSFFEKNVAAIGEYVYTGQVTIIDEKALNVSTYKVKLQANENTTADRIYTVTIYTLVGTEENALAFQTVSWTASQVAARTQKTLVFSSLDLSPYVRIWTEITH